MALGSQRGDYLYIDDAANTWLLRIAIDKVEGVVPATGLVVYDPATPVTNFKGRVSPNKCRRVYAEGPISDVAGARVVRRYFICTIGSPLYEKDQPQAITYKPQDEAAALTLISTGRRGEKVTF